MMATDPSVISSQISLAITSMVFALVAHFIARDKGRRRWLWTVVGVIPFVNLFALLYLVGAINLRMERKLDRLLALLETATPTIVPPATPASPGMPVAPGAPGVPGAPGTTGTQAERPSADFAAGSTANANANVTAAAADLG